MGVHYTVFLFMLEISLEKRLKKKRTLGENVPFKLTKPKGKYVLYQNSGKHSVPKDEPS